MLARSFARMDAGSHLADPHHFQYQQEGAVAKVVTCPSCQAKGSSSRRRKGRQNSLSQMRSDVRRQGGVGWSGLGDNEETGLRRRPAAAPPRPAPPPMTILKAPSPCPPLPAPASRRGMAAIPARSQSAQGQGSGQSPMLYVVLGVGSVAVLLLIGLLIAVLMRGNGNGNAGNVAVAPVIEARPQVAEVAPTPQPIQPAPPRPQ